ncbi:hypothetical protein [Sinosporangium siamense]|uniref:Uncharacterized protein n=1 Tax=Sinosporangium siamense TaxID=1367973 RepID=A0A919REF8_9ACTN|nr:hypothetical protein [Sinosporangium siamense]GII91902.1 hypothetical protein Ssi02_21330 [Sinosporangium siamense]
MNWMTGEGLIGCDDPSEVDAAFDRKEHHVGAAVIGLALNCPDVAIVAPRAVRALASGRPETINQGLTALSHMVRINHSVDKGSLAHLRLMLKDKDLRKTAELYAADICIYVAHGSLPLWLRMWSLKFNARYRISGWYASLRNDIQELLARKNR